MNKKRMWEIREYFKNIIIIIIALFFFLWCIKAIIGSRICFREKNFLKIVFLLYIIALTTQAIFPKFIIGLKGISIIETGRHKINLIPLMILKDVYIESIVKGNVAFFLINVIGNIMLFVPIGICLPKLWNVSYRKTLLFGFCYSLFIEVSQLFMPRVTDVDDLILNYTGVLIGVLIYRNICKKIKQHKVRDKG